MKLRNNNNINNLFLTVAPIIDSNKLKCIGRFDKLGQ